MQHREEPLPAMRITTSKRVAPEDVDRAQEVIARVLAQAPEPVLSVHLTLGVLADPAARNPAMVSVRVDLNGRPVNAHAAGPGMPHAIALAGERLRVRLERMSRTRQARRGHHHSTALEEAGR
ncbi:hypothetical protein [Thermomonospora cellulosilytica]|uniref:Ribosome-associated translation inhibitor RaiA n=1 Tax=Thermomonospora cellulosilytica TaxID=1411118 RepID=A0A7W3MVW0_9ACTN|nr:hypothetical protein [Thermomonospora cellulosilytica]MBA9002794.1 ribosome-associated translation inhibitor RaiA [Thermomonospora cellulosilytica]